MKRLTLLIALSFIFSVTITAQWTQQFCPVSVNLHGVFFTSPSDGWVVGQNGVILHTTNGGANWSVTIPSPTDYHLYGITFIDPFRGYTVGDGNTILATVNGGESWKYLDDESSEYYSTSYYSIKISKNETRGWVVGGRQIASFSAVIGIYLGFCAPQVQNYLGRCVGMDFIDDKVGWVSGMDWLIMKTTNGGITWIPQESGISGKDYGYNAIKFFNPEIGLAVGDDGVIQKSVDGGTTWYNIRRSSEVLFSIDIHSDSSAHVVGTMNTILLTTDQGESWHAQSTPVPDSTAFDEVFFIDGNEGWIVGTNGTILHTTNGGATAVTENINRYPSEFSMKPGYPNPFNPSTAVEYDIPRTSRVSMKIYDITGREVVTLFEGSKDPGRYTAIWNADGFASGVYYIRLSAKGVNINYSTSQKIILVK